MVNERKKLIEAFAIKGEVGKRILLCLAVMLMLSVVMVPHSVNASEPDKWITDDEARFIFQLSSRMQEAYVTIGGHRDWLKKYGNVEMVSRIAFATRGKASLPVPSTLLFRGCMLYAPDTMSDIASTWNDEVCNEFDYLRQKMNSFDEGVTALQFSADLVMVRITLGQIESSMSKIDKMTGERIDDLCTMKEAEEEAKEEAEEETKEDDDFCFIATAAYGTPTAVEIDELRRFRDEYLRKNYLGNEFIKFYYANSPPIAKYISEHETLRTIVREGFVEPVVEIIELTESGWAE